MNRLIEQHPGEIMVVAFVAMGVGFLLAAVVVEALGGLAGVGYPGLIDGASWQAATFPPR
jgi:hypothetical protein